MATDLATFNYSDGYNSTDTSGLPFLQIAPREHKRNDSHSTNSTGSGKAQYPEHLSTSERLALIEPSLSKSVTLFTWVPNRFEVEIAVKDVPFAMLSAFSPLFKYKLEQELGHVFVLPVSAKDDVIWLVNWMTEFCVKEDKYHKLDLEDCSVQEWISLWNTADTLRIYPATRQLSQQCYMDCKELCRTQLLDAWLACKPTTFKEARRQVHKELANRFLEKPPHPNLLEQLWCLASEEEFTKVAVASFAKHTFHGNAFVSQQAVPGFDSFPKSLKATINASWKTQAMIKKIENTWKVEGALVLESQVSHREQHQKDPPERSSFH